MLSKGTLGFEPALQGLLCSVTTHRVLSTSKALQTKTKSQAISGQEPTSENWEEMSDPKIQAQER